MPKRKRRSHTIIYIDMITEQFGHLSFGSRWQIHSRARLHPASFKGVYRHGT